MQKYTYFNFHINFRNSWYTTVQVSCDTFQNTNNCIKLTSLQYLFYKVRQNPIETKCKEICNITEPYYLLGTKMALTSINMWRNIILYCLLLNFKILFYLIFEHYCYCTLIIQLLSRSCTVIWRKFIYFLKWQMDRVLERILL